MFRSRSDIVICIFLFFLSLVVFSRGLSIHGLEYRDDEIFYFQSTQEMVATGDIFSPKYFGENRFQKPILYYWMVLVAYKIFGVNWPAARSVAVLFSGLTVCVTWLIGKILFDRKTATLSALILISVPLFFRHAKNVVPDMPLNFFIVWAMYCAIRFMQISSGAFGSSDENLKATTWSVFFFIACALGFMIKGFAALIVPLLTVILFSFWIRKPGLLSEMRFGRGTAIMVFIIAPWFLYMIRTHGQTYLDYMLVDETKNRLVNIGASNVLLNIMMTFFRHCAFYLKVIGSYFAPWSVFLVMALPLAIARIHSKDEKNRGLLFLLTWFCVVYFLFSTMYFAINHYMLVLTTPFALMTGYFLVTELNKEIFIGKAVSFLRKYLILFMLTAGCLAFGFLFVFLAGGAQWWLFVLAAVYVFVVGRILRNPEPVIAPLVLSVFMIFVFAQSSLMEKAGITAHATLQKFAATVNQDLEVNTSSGTMIGVGSHDIHEKEFQVYFNQRIVKAAGSEEEETRTKLGRLFANDKMVYCLMTEKDYDGYLKEYFPETLEIVQEEYIFRRRMHLDRGFFLALLRLDQAVVRDYLKEKIILVRKGRHVRT
ncbi:MAG: glycosyltransferase family 39 protein [Candidatus Omnitrophica bacterium]|nr:glycosyltransferase family 39 protein [Candidatus Omnitrophota bacterium]